MTTKKTGKHLKILKERQSESTRKAINQALARFEIGKLEKLPKYSKLTRLNLSLEAGVTRDTPFARYRKDSEKVGEYRYPEIVDKFNSLRENQKKNNSKGTKVKQQVIIYKSQIRELQDLLAMSRNVVNAQDILIDDLKKRIKSTEESISVTIKNYEEKILNLNDEIVSLKRHNIRILSPKP
jgi:hypothetical protein